MQVMSQGQITIPLVREQVSLAFQRSILALPFEYVISVVCVAACWLDRVPVLLSCSTIDTHTAPTLAGAFNHRTSPQAPLIKALRLCVFASRSLPHYVCGQTGLWSNR